MPENEDVQVDNEQGTETQAAQELTPHQQFLEMLPEDLREDPTFSPYKGESVNEIIGKLAKSHVNVNKLVGADKNAVLKIPSAEDDKEGWGAIYNKLGRPETVDGYDLDKYKEVSGVDPEKLKEIAAIAHEDGVSAKAFSRIVDKYFEQAGAMQQTSEKDVEAAIEKYQEDLKGEWGEAYEAKTSKVLSTLKEKATPEFLQLAADFPYIFDNPAVIKTFDNIIKMSAEDSGVKTGSSGGNAPMTPAEARAAIAAMEGDSEKMKIMMTSGDPRRESLMQERDRLFKYAYPS